MKITYDYENMKAAGQLLERLTVRGMDNVRILAEVGNILDSGVLEGKEEKKENK